MHRCEPKGFAGLKLSLYNRRTITSWLNKGWLRPAEERLLQPGLVIIYRWYICYNKICLGIQYVLTSCSVQTWLNELIRTIGEISLALTLTDGLIYCRHISIQFLHIFNLLMKSFQPSKWFKRGFECCIHFVPRNIRCRSLIATESS